MLAATAFVAMPACSSDDAAEKDANEAGKQIEDEAGEVQKDVEKEVED